MKARKRLAAAVARICQRELNFALILQRNGSRGWEPRDRETQWRSILSPETTELLDAAPAAGIWRPDVGAILDRPVDPSGDDPLRARTIHDADRLAQQLLQEEAL